MKRLAKKFLRLTATAALVLCLGGTVFAAAAAEPRPAADFTASAAAEATTHNSLLAKVNRWNLDATRDISRALPSLPAAGASQAIWMAAMAPAPLRVDTTQLLANALTSPLPSVRRHAAAILTIQATPDAKRLVYNRLLVEPDSEVVKYMVGALAHRPSPEGVRNLMDIMLMQGIKPEVAAAAGGYLRKLTRSNLPDNPSAWRDWWLDNAHLYGM